MYRPDILSHHGASFIKLPVDFILKVYVGTKVRFCIRTKVLRFIKPYARTCTKIPLIIPVRGRLCARASPPRYHHIWSLQRLVLLCIISSAYHVHAYSHPRDSMFTQSKVQEIKEICDKDFKFTVSYYHWTYSNRTMDHRVSSSVRFNIEVSVHHRSLFSLNIFSHNMRSAV